MTTLNTKIEERRGELAMCKVDVGKEVLSTTLSHKINVPKPKNFKGTRSTREMDNFLWKMEQYF
ncbi:hypothetical protein J1N35_004086 [Gossypium stocksii]|uniref:Uncharacterized protein n=1 Tax=Gossypium stocksii TaxID=47602 RepID=A0A9D3WB53_9ROSI|nr:hypothetical protein J1N35_004086 [Gossypium stocksii]